MLLGMEKTGLDDCLLEHFLGSDRLGSLNFDRRTETLRWGCQLLTEDLSYRALLMRLKLAL